MTARDSHVEWVDTDASGVHHHTAVARWAEATEAQWIRGLALDGYFASARRVHYEVDLEAPLRFGDRVETVLRVEDVGRSSLRLAFEVHADSGRAASGRYVVVHVELDADGRPSATPWPSSWVAAFGAPAVDGAPATDGADARTAR